MQDSRSAIVYLHGFNSSPRSQKVSELKSLLPLLHPDVELVVPELGFDPELAFKRACEAVESVASRCAGVIGSSMGGYYAAALSERYGVKVALINPVVYPYRLLRDHLGSQYNPYTGERYELNEAHITSLKVLDPGALTDPGKVFLLLQTGDETLAYGQALERYPGSAAWIQPGGDHRFQQFQRVIPAILSFFGVPCHRGAIG